MFSSNQSISKVETIYFAAMTNQQLMDSGNRMMDETDQAIERSKQVSVCSEDDYSFQFQSLVVSSVVHKIKK